MYNDHFEQFTLTLADILKSVKKLKDKRMNTYGLRSSHVMVLYLLGREENGLTPVELAESGSVDKALISRIITELTEKGFVTNHPADGKRYKARLTLTPMGKETSHHIAAMINDIQQQVGSDISEKDMEIFYRVLFTLRDNFRTIASQIENE